ncbi:MAG TPA: glycosyltransferase family 1 protein [Chloroflexota bacterium]|nr:glycosyltransferase family 1 protein [Chloroflexota bacterium]
MAEGPLIGIDASRAVRPHRTGTEGYSFHLISALLGQASPHRYRLYVDRPLPPGFFSDFKMNSRAEPRIIRLPRLWTHLGLGRELRRFPPDLLYVPAHVIPVACPVPAVVTIHDLGYLWHRTAYTPLAWLLLHLGTLHNVRTARLIVADSQATATDLTTHLGVAADRIRVAYLGAPPSRGVSPSPELTTRYGLPRRYFLFVGTLQPRKNLPRLIAAFGQLARKQADVAMVLVGAAGLGAPALHRQAEKLGIADRIHWLGYVPDQDLPALFAGAVAFVFPSLYEGFGMPVLEAMARGTPVITSNSSSLPEVVGDAGLLVSPYDVTALATAMIRLLDDQSLRADLIERGRHRVAQFSWGHCADVVRRVFDEALESTAGWH